MKLWDVIEYLNKEGTLLYKHECENFNTNTKLIVREGQVALFIKNGAVYDSFGPGRHSLKTENLPLLSKIGRAFTTGGKNSYSAEIFFISTVDQMNIKWGTRNPMDLQDPNYKVIVKVGASGEAMFSVTEPIKFVRKLSGTNTVVNPESLTEYFRSIINSYVKNCISDALAINKISILDINSCLIKISESTNSFLNNKIEEYGLTVKNFSVDTIYINENDPSLIKLKSILEKKAEMDILGYTYQQERSFDVMENATSNPGTTGIANSLMGIGLGFGLAKPIGQGVADIANSINTQAPVQMQNNLSAQKQDSGSLANGWSCACGQTNITTNFCPNCGSKKPQATPTWNCSNCGARDLKSAFCPNCGFQKPSETWTCACGQTNITTNFCPNCGNKRP